MTQRLPSFLPRLSVNSPNHIFDLVFVVNGAAISAVILK
jgi:hypothetical protein